MVSLRTLTDDELLRHAEVDFDPLTGTELEAELMRRFEDNAAIPAENEPLLKVLEDHGIEEPAALIKALKALGDMPVERVGSLLDVLLEFDIDDPVLLKKQLDRIAKFDEVMNDLAQPLATLQTLVLTE